ncbi:hypothetical protein CANCADRAFT_32395 [Tortispora caseinolytica NRRL Y-17796]|uniref:Cell division control protein 73 C-terminal domain-containing protein n=1 Tax=Tortispora caseinolytica NRRL Y-17796 TaxID=767744 RepID=A0A1E4TB44_9ASCO|nr:hypothetical protein CANCADRAFT_32395 [Tortispora caseinolytica NRRL Y-17796]
MPSVIDPLEALRAACVQKGVIELLESEDGTPTEDINIAQYVRLNDKTLSLNSTTRFKHAGDENGVNLRQVIFCWLCKDLNVAEYISKCEENDIEDFPFLERADLIAYLEGSVNESQFIEPTGGETRRAKGRDEFSPALKRIYAAEKPLINHNTVLHGTKTIDFGYVRKEAQQMFLQKNSQQTNRQTVASPASSHGSGSRNRDPIILLSPSASAILNMSNIKDFLSNGRFEPPSASSDSNFLFINRTSPRLGRTVRFAFVDSTERFKPDYWDRVVAVFTTGQAWQFKSYKWSNPNDLFQKVKGFYVSYANDNAPAATKSWNIEKVSIDRTHRFRDREISEHIWDSIEKWMLAHGWARR